jgi:hypothetical protein
MMSVPVSAKAPESTFLAFSMARTRSFSTSLNCLSER